MTAPMSVQQPACDWRAADVADTERWIEVLSESELEELDAALRVALEKSDDILDIERADFPLPTLRARLLAIERELIDGRGFALLRGLPRERYSQSEMEMLYWGIGMHLGAPWPQNQYGHVLGDVTDQGIAPEDPTSRGNEIGRIAFPYHSDGSDLVGLMCLQKARSGGSRPSPTRSRSTTTWCARRRSSPPRSMPRSPTTSAAPSPRAADPGTRCPSSPRGGSGSSSDTSGPTSSPRSATRTRRGSSRWPKRRTASDLAVGGRT